MLDPFPVPPSPTLARLIHPLATSLHLPTLPFHAHEIVLSFLFYTFLHTTVSPFLSARLFPAIYPSLRPSTRMNWNVHVVSLVQSLFVNTLALSIILAESPLRASLDWRGRIFGYTGAGGFVQACAAGYFLWDVVVSALDVATLGVGSLVHAVAALVVTMIGFRPFANYYGTSFILYELSSPFLNVHWFCDKLQMTGSRLQLWNGIALLATFFGCRLVWGSWQTVLIYRDIYAAVTGTPGGADIKGVGAGGVGVNERGIENGEGFMAYGGDGLPVWLWATYLAVNTVLSFLNFYWFGLMVGTVRKRFRPQPQPQPQREKVEKNGKAE